MSAGLPNITGSASMKGHTGMVLNPVVSGSFKRGTKTYTACATTASQTSYDLVFDASLYNPEIYGNSETVTPLSQTTNFLIKY